MGKPKISVCFTPDLLHYHISSGQSIVVVADILRATTSMCTALANGAKAIVPVAGGIEDLRLKVEDLRLKVEDLRLKVEDLRLETADRRPLTADRRPNTDDRRLTTDDLLIAGEQDGIKLPYAVLGNSPLEFTREVVAGKTIIFSTTNGTKAILKAKEYGEVFIGSFLNIKALEAFLSKEKKDVIILCAGWKGQFSLEDTLFAGKLASMLVEEHDFLLEDDAARASIRLWQATGNRLQDFARMSSHYQRLLTLESEEGLRYCFEPPEAAVLPKLADDKILNFEF